MPSSRSFPLSPAAPQHASPFYQKHKMSLTQTYYLAHTARSKLSKEAARPEYDLRVLVGHANLLDGLMIELADAEREQESWFNNSVRKAQSTTTTTTTSSSSSSSRSRSPSISWADSLPPVMEDSSSDEESDSSDEDMTDDEPVLVRRRAPSPHSRVYANVTEMEVDSDEDEDEDDIAEDEETDSEELALTRTSSRASFSSPPDSPPELLHELDTSDEEEEEESATPPSPPTEVFPAPQIKGAKQQQQTLVSLKQDNDWQSAASSRHTPELYI